MSHLNFDRTFFGYSSAVVDMRDTTQDARYFTRWTNRRSRSAAPRPLLTSYLSCGDDMTPPSGAMSLASSMFDRCACCVINDSDVLPHLDERPVVTSVSLQGGKTAATDSELVNWRKYCLHIQRGCRKLCLVFRYLVCVGC